MSWIAETLSGSGENPSSLTTSPIYWTLFTRSWILSRLNLTLRSRGLVKTLPKIKSCSYSSLLPIMISSKIGNAPEIWPKCLSAILWPTSLAHEISNGILLSRYRPKGVLNTQRNGDLVLRPLDLGTSKESISMSSRHFVFCHSCGCEKDDAVDILKDRR